MRRRRNLQTAVGPIECLISAIPPYSRKPAKARWDWVESASRFRFLIEHDLFGKPLYTFPDHALIDIRQPAQGRAEQLARAADQRGAVHHGVTVGESAGDADADRVRAAEQGIVVLARCVATDQHLALEGVVLHRVGADVIKISVTADDLAVA